MTHRVIRQALIAILLILLCPAAWSEEASCPLSYSPETSWLELGAQCEKGDIMVVFFNSKDGIDMPRIAAAFCELDGITFLRSDQVDTLICRYRGAQRQPRETLKKLGR